MQMLLAATAVIQFCAQAFSLYAYQTAIYEIFTDQARDPVYCLRQQSRCAVHASAPNADYTAVDLCKGAFRAYTRSPTL